MSEYIDRQALLDAITPTKEDKQISLYGAVADFISLVCDVPTADVAPVVHGEWLNIEGDYTFAACSICETAYEVATEEEAEKGLWDAFMCSHRYCPNCGAKMDGGMKHDKP